MTDQNSSLASGWQIYKRLLSYTRPFLLWFGIGTFGLAIYALTQMAWAQLMEFIINVIEAKDLEARGVIALAILGIFVIRGFGSFLGNYGISYVARHVVHTLRVQMFERMLHFPVAYFDRQAAGNILSKYTYDVEQVAAATTDALQGIIREGLTVIGLLGFLFYKNWILSLILIAIAPIIGIIMSYASKRLNVVSTRIQNSIGDVTHVASETINGFPVVKTFGGESYERERFTKVSDNNLKQSIKLVVVNSINTPLVQFVVALAMSFMIWLALSPELFRDTSTGELMAFITAAALVSKPLKALTQINTKLQQGIAGARSVFDLLDSSQEIDEGVVEIERAKGRLEFRDVSFRYNETTTDVLKQINLIIEPGETIALVGKSGAGKTTLVNMIPGFVKPTCGTILLDDKPLSDYRLESLRRQIALVSQKVTLFNDSVAQNIAYGILKTADIVAIEAAASDANAMEFIKKMTSGLDTQVGQDGVQLSGGQRQRIAIARAILKNAPVLVLDEATSALDTESERLIQDALARVVKDRTTIIIAHRLSTIEKADRILFMDNGEVLESGTHHELLGKRGAYFNLHQIQFMDHSV